MPQRTLEQILDDAERKAQQRKKDREIVEADKKAVTKWFKAKYGESPPRTVARSVQLMKFEGLQRDREALNKRYPPNAAHARTAKAAAPKRTVAAPPRSAKRTRR